LTRPGSWLTTLTRFELGSGQVRPGPDEANDVAPVAVLLCGVGEDLDHEAGVDEATSRGSPPQTPLRPPGITVGHGCGPEAGRRNAATSADCAGVSSEVPPATISPFSVSGVGDGQDEPGRLGDAAGDRADQDLGAVPVTQFGPGPHPADVGFVDPFQDQSLDPDVGGGVVAQPLVAKQTRPRSARRGVGFGKEPV
jgi:hypothetical protein